MIKKNYCYLLLFCAIYSLQGAVKKSPFKVDPSVSKYNNLQKTFFFLAGGSSNFWNLQTAPKHLASTLCFHVFSRANQRIEQQSRGRVTCPNSTKLHLAITLLERIAPYFFQENQTSIARMLFHIFKISPDLENYSAHTMRKLSIKNKYLWKGTQAAIVAISRIYFGFLHTQNALKDIEKECADKKISSDVIQGVTHDHSDYLLIESPYMHLVELLTNFRSIYFQKCLPIKSKIIIFMAIKALIPQCKKFFIPYKTLNKLSIPLQQRLFDINFAEEHEHSRSLFKEIAVPLLGLNHNDYLNNIFKPDQIAHEPKNPEESDKPFWRRYQGFSGFGWWNKPK
jgi:hypothetical protein